MRKIALFMLMLVFAGFANAQDETLPPKVQASFDAKYPGQEEPYWENKNGLFVFEFEFQEIDLIAYFSASGEWIKTKEYLDELSVPAAITAAIEKKYPDALAYDFYKVTLPGNKTGYELKIDTDTASFNITTDASGNVTSSQIIEE